MTNLNTEIINFTAFAIFSLLVTIGLFGVVGFGAGLLGKAALIGLIKVVGAGMAVSGFIGIATTI